MPKDLKSRIASATAEATKAPSLIPGDVTPPPPKEEEAVPALKDLITDKRDYLTIRRLITADLELADQIRGLKAAQKPLVTQIKNLLGKNKVNRALMDDAKVNYYSGIRKSIKGAKLLERGVSPEDIVYATEEKTVYTLKITRVGHEDEGEDE